MCVCVCVCWLPQTLQLTLVKCTKWTIFCESKTWYDAMGWCLENSGFSHPLPLSWPMVLPPPPGSYMVLPRPSSCTIMLPAPSSLTLVLPPSLLLDLRVIPSSWTLVLPPPSLAMTSLHDHRMIILLAVLEWIRISVNIYLYVPILLSIFYKFIDIPRYYLCMSSNIVKLTCYLIVHDGKSNTCKITHFDPRRYAPWCYMLLETVLCALSGL